MDDTAWTDGSRQRWPRDPSGYLFLGRAVDQLGQSMFPGEWRVTDPDARLSELSGGPRLVTRAPEPPRGLRGSSVERLVVPRIAPELAARLAERQLAADAVAREAIVRFAAVREKIIGWAESGSLPTAYLVGSTGEMIDIPPALWNADRTNRRFVTCRLVFSEIDRTSPRNAASAPVFVDVNGFKILREAATTVDSQTQPPASTIAIRRVPTNAEMKSWATEAAMAGYRIGNVNKAVAALWPPALIPPKRDAAREALRSALDEAGKPTGPGRPAKIAKSR